MANDAEVAEFDGAVTCAHAGVVGGRPTRAGHGVGEREVEAAGGGGVDADGDALGGAAPGAAAQGVEARLGGGDFGSEDIAGVVELGLVGGGFGALLVEKGEGGGEFGEGGARGVFGGRREQGGLDQGVRAELALEELAAVVEGAALFEEGGEFVFEGFYAGVRGGFDEDLARAHVEDRGGGGASAGDLERLVDEVGREAGEG